MCDYSLHLVASRPAKVGDTLIATDFARSITRGFTAVGEPDVAVCLLPGTELAFASDVQYDRAFSLFGKARVEHKVARFRQIKCTIRTSTTTRANFPAVRLSWSRV